MRDGITLFFAFLSMSSATATAMAAASQNILLLSIVGPICLLSAIIAVTLMVTDKS